MLEKYSRHSPGVAPVPNTDLQLKLPESNVGTRGQEKDNGSGQKLVEITGSALSKRKLLVGLDLLCLVLGKYNLGYYLFIRSTFYDS